MAHAILPELVFLNLQLKKKIEINNHGSDCKAYFDSYYRKHIKLYLPSKVS